LTQPPIKKFFVQALPSDNPYGDEHYIDGLKEIFKHRPELIDAYIYGSWDSFEGMQVIIKNSYLRRAKTLTFHLPERRRLIVCDPARHGEDETVIYAFENTRIVDQDIMGKNDGVQAANHIAKMAKDHSVEVTGTKEYVPLIVIDEIGYGGIIGDFLRDWGFPVHFINSSNAALDKTRFGNLRAEMWWTVAERYADGAIEEGTHNDSELDRQITAVEYELKRGRIYVEDKDKVKIRIGRSPDRADAKIMGLYALQYAQPIKPKRDAWAEDEPKVSHWSS